MKKNEYNSIKAPWKLDVQNVCGWWSLLNSFQTSNFINLNSWTKPRVGFLHVSSGNLRWLWNKLLTISPCRETAKKRPPHVTHVDGDWYFTHKEACLNLRSTQVVHHRLPTSFWTLWFQTRMFLSWTNSGHQSFHLPNKFLFRLIYFDKKSNFQGSDFSADNEHGLSR